jgi:SAM-dependent methyltransferase
MQYRKDDEEMALGTEMDILDSYTDKAPSVQNILDIFSGEWSSSLPLQSGLKTTPGSANLFEDPRIDYAEKAFGGFKGKRILELGPLEAGHSYMLHQKGAAQIVAVEANSRAYMKSLCIKEIYGLNKLKLLYGDFRAFFQKGCECFDIIIASGVLCHVTDPLQLIKQISCVSDNLYISTHYYDPDIIKTRFDLHSKFGELETVEINGSYYQSIEYYYDGALNWNGFCGGPAPSSRWLTRYSILEYLKANGYNNIDVSHESKNHPYGPCFSICAKRN